MSRSVTLKVLEVEVDGVRFTLTPRAYTAPVRERAAAEVRFAVEAVQRLTGEARDELRQISGVPDHKRAGAIDEWLRRWHVETDGMREWAEAYVFSIEDPVQPTVELVLGERVARLDFPAPRPFTLQDETREEYVHRSLAWAKERAEAVWAVAERIRSEENDVPDALLPFLFGYAIVPSGKKQVDKPRTNLNSHCKWLARYQVGKESFSAISTSVRRRRSAVTDAVTSIANLLDLPLREPTPGGRPKGR